MKHLKYLDNVPISLAKRHGEVICEVKIVCNLHVLIICLLLIVDKWLMIAVNAGVAAQHAIWLHLCLHPNRINCPVNETSIRNVVWLARELQAFCDLHES